MATRRAAGARPPRLPDLLNRKIYKTGQTRGADDDEIFQNRVSRTSTVLIPYGFWGACREELYVNGSIVLIPPATYFGWQDPQAQLAGSGLTLGHNAVVFYETRDMWNAHNPETLGWEPANQRQAPLGGQYVARIPATTSVDNGARIVRGYHTTSMKGAGIRVYEYASELTIEQCRLQLEALVWHCVDAEAVMLSAGMSLASAQARKRFCLGECEAAGLWDYDRLNRSRVLNGRYQTICPLCLEPLSAQGFFDRMAQADGRDVPDLTVTQINLFHIHELRVGAFNHRPYNLGWGHHHCNVVVKDSGIEETLAWMVRVIDRNKHEGLLNPPPAQTEAGLAAP
jgi:hypothetical protein